VAGTKGLLRGGKPRKDFFVWGGRVPGRGKGENLKKTSRVHTNTPHSRAQKTHRVGPGGSRRKFDWLSTTDARIAGIRPIKPEEEETAGWKRGFRLLGGSRGGGGGGGGGGRYALLAGRLRNVAS